MITKGKFISYILFLSTLAIWLGAALHETIASNISWYGDPLAWINHAINCPEPGAINPWPISTMLLLLATILNLILFIRYKGSGRREILIAIAGALLTLIVTFVYFVPTLGKIFGHPSDYTNDELISMSRLWVILNVIRGIALMVLFIVGLFGFAKISNQSKNQ